MGFDRAEPHMQLNKFSLRQSRLKWSFFIRNTMRNAPYVHPRLDSILELCQTFQIVGTWCTSLNKDPT